MKKNIDQITVDSFGDEWDRFDQSALSDKEAESIFNKYFSIFPWHKLPENSVGFDMGCGSGRWAKLISPKVGHLNCIDPSSALDIAKKNLSNLKNVSFFKESVDSFAIEKNSQDFGYSLGVLHHVPDTSSAILSCTSRLKSGAPFLIYLYYAFDNRSFLFKLIWRISDLFRKVICTMPPLLKHFVTDIIAIFVYLPFAKSSKALEKAGLRVDSIPLSFYRNNSFYTMRTDSRDRFGTPLEQRFTKKEIEQMMQSAGLTDIVFSEETPYWCALGIKK
jgi:ubiquinone/menaquinone biosynthesis C-methylase UbiE